MCHILNKYDLTNYMMQYMPTLKIGVNEIEEGDERQKTFDERVKRYSITPRTFKDRELEGENNVIFKEAYSCSSNAVFRFGIDVSIDEFDIATEQSQSRALS